ncbi:hypothetical protein ACROYT_G006777 [Oculina patagonica]
MHLESRLANDEYRNWIEVGQALLLLSDVLQSFAAKEIKALYDLITAMVGSGTKCHCTYAPRKHNTHSCKWAQAITSYHRDPTKIAWWVSNSSKWDDAVSGPSEIARVYFGEKSIGGLRYLQLLRRCSYFNVSERVLSDVVDVWKNLWGDAPNQRLGHDEKLRAIDAITKVLQEPLFRKDPNTKKALKDIQSIGFWDRPRVQTAEVNVVCNYRELLEKKRQKMARDIMDLDTNLENIESLLTNVQVPGQRQTSVPLRDSLFWLFNFLAVNFKLFTKSRKDVSQQLMSAIYQFLTVFTFYISVMLILVVVCILVGGIAAAFAAVTCSRFAALLKYVKM